MTDDKQKKVGPIHATTETFDQILADAGDKPVLVDFFATWCGPCKMIAPLIEDLAAENAGIAVVVKLDVDQHGEIAQRFGVMSIPTLFVFKKGEVIDKGVGFMPKPQLQMLIDKHLSK